MHLNGIFTETNKDSVNNRKILAEFIARTGPKRIAEYGGGFGALAPLLAHSLPEASIEMREPHPSQLARALRAPHRNISFVNQLLGKYDVIIALDVLEHGTNPLSMGSSLGHNLSDHRYLFLRNCFHLVIKCHLPYTFYLREPFAFLMKKMGFVLGEKIRYTEAYREGKKLVPSQNIRVWIATAKIFFLCKNFYRAVKATVKTHPPIQTLHIHTSTLRDRTEALIRSLCNVLSGMGIEASALAGRSASGDDGFLRPDDRNGISAWCRWRGLQYCDIQMSHLLPAHPKFNEADLLHLHHLHGNYFNYWSLPALTAQKPTVGTVHDMLAITGTCAYSLKCERWTPAIGCGHWPHLETCPSLSRDTTHRLWHDKQIIYTHSAVTLVTPSLWLQRLVEKSILGEPAPCCLPNAVDTGIFRHQNNAVARRRMGQPETGRAVGSCAHGGVANPRKGSQYVIDAAIELKILFPGLLFLNIGVKTPPAELQHMEWERHISYVTSRKELATLYGALDILLSPTLGDNPPLVCIESLCCGTPVVGFATGGVPEIVRPGEDGLLVPTHEGAGLVRATATHLQKPDLRNRMGLYAAATAAERFNLELFAKRYAKIYVDVVPRARRQKKPFLPLKNVPLIVRSPQFMKSRSGTCAPGRDEETRASLPLQEFPCRWGAFFPCLALRSGCSANSGRFTVQRSAPGALPAEQPDRNVFGAPSRGGPRGFAPLPCFSPLPQLGCLRAQ